MLTEYSPGCTPCQWVVPSASFHLAVSKIDDGDANTWRFSIKAKDVMIAPRANSGSVDLDATEPLTDVVEGRGEANFYVVPPESFSPTHVDKLTLPTGEATVVRAPGDKGDEYLPPTDLHVTFDTIALNATLKRSRD